MQDTKLKFKNESKYIFIRIKHIMQIKFLKLTIFPESHRLAIIKQFSPIMAKNPQWIRNILF